MSATPLMPMWAWSDCSVAGADGSTDPEYMPVTGCRASAQRWYDPRASFWRATELA